jgi:hypothetical protein
MALRLGYYRNDALKRVFRLSGQGYASTTGVIRKRVDAMLWNYWRKPAPAA